MNTLLEAIAEGWGWKLGRPAAIIETNCFGNAIVMNEQGNYFRIVPEELACELLARSPEELHENRSTEDFIRDWTMEPLVASAKACQGSLAEGRVYCLAVPAVLGGEYVQHNIRTISLPELLSSSGAMARQIEGLPDGTPVRIVADE